MAEPSDLERVWDIVERVEVCMFTTRCANGFRARPLEARPDRKDGLIWFVTDLHSGKESEINLGTDVKLVFVDGNANVYLSITARAEVASDPAKAAEIWKSTNNMWWRGPDDPNVGVLRVGRSLRNYGTDRRARPLLRSSLSRQSLPAKNQPLVKIAK